MIFDKIKEPIKKLFSPDDEIKSSVPELTNLSKPDTFQADGSLVSWNLSFDIVIKSIKDLVIAYRNTASNFEVSLAIEDIVNEAIVKDEDFLVNLDLDNIEEVNDKIKDKIKEEFVGILRLLDFNRNADEIFKKWYIDGRLYYQNIVSEKNVKNGILKLNLLSPLDIIRLKDTNTNKYFYVWKQDENEKIKHFGFVRSMSDDAGNKTWQIPEQLITFVPSGLTNDEETLYISHIHKSIKPMNQLKIIEDSAVIYRITRAPERRVFNIDVGRLPKKKAESYVRKLINQFKNKMTYDVNTGKVNQNNGSMTLMEDFYLPSRSDQRGTKVETLNSGNLIDKIEDIQYFKRKLYKSLNVPISRIDDDDSPTVNFGQQGEITREELKFSKFIFKIRDKFSKYLFLDLLKKQLIFKKILDAKTWYKIEQDIIFNWATNSYYAQLKENEILSNKIELIQEMEDTVIGKYYSHETVRKKILKQTEDEIKEEDKLIEKELKDKKYQEDDE